MRLQSWFDVLWITKQADVRFRNWLRGRTCGARCCCGCLWERCSDFETIATAATIMCGASSSAIIPALEDLGPAGGAERAARFPCAVCRAGETTRYLQAEEVEVLQAWMDGAGEHRLSRAEDGRVGLPGCCMWTKAGSVKR